MKRILISLCVLGAVAVGTTVAAAQNDAETPEVAAPVAPSVQPWSPPVVIADAAAPALEVVPPVETVPAAEPVVTEPAAAAPTPTLPVVAPLVTNCEVGHAGNIWGAYGVTEQPLGTTFTYRLTVDGVATDYPLVTRQGSVQVKGVTYGDGYAPGVRMFGFTQVDLPRVTGTVIFASVLLDGAEVCSGGNA